MFTLVIHASVSLVVKVSTNIDFAIKDNLQKAGLPSSKFVLLKNVMEFVTFGLDAHPP